MTVFDHPDFDQHELVAFSADPASGLQAIIAVHSSNLGPGVGGCRMFPYASSEAALTDVLRLSRGMTYKSALAGLPLGGGKAVIIGNPQQQKSRQLLLAMADFVDSLNGKYITAEDLGTTVEDMAVIAERTRFVSGLSTANDGGGDPSPTTAQGVYQGIQAAVKYQLRTDLQGVRIAIQGLGKVGYALAGLLLRDGAIVYGADYNAANTTRAVAELGIVAMSADEILAADVDVLAPCALGNVISSATVGAIRAQVIAGAANNQLANPQMGRVLMERDILYAPDYVINAGGIIDVYFQTQGIRDQQRLMSHVARIGDTLTEIFQRSMTQWQPTSEIADHMAEEIFNSPVRRIQVA